MLGVRSQINTKATASCQKRKAQGKLVVCPTKVTVALPFVEPVATRNAASAVDPGPVGTDSETDSQCRWSTVVKKTSKRASNLCAEQSSPLVSVKKPGNLSLAPQRLQPLPLFVKRKRKANVFATRFPTEQSADDLIRFLDGKLNVNVTCLLLKSKYPEHYRSFMCQLKWTIPRCSLMDTSGQRGSLSNGSNLQRRSNSRTSERQIT